jgi:hypothetical protein
MFSLLKKITMALVVAVLAPFSFALEINQNNYETYIGDVDGDGDGDYYFKQKPWTLILHGEIATPLLLKGTNNFVIYNTLGEYTAPESFSLTDTDLTMRLASGSLKLGRLNVDIFVVSSASGATTLFLRGWEESASGLLLISASNLMLPTVVRSYSANTYVGISNRNFKVQIRDINGDGINDIELKNTVNEQCGRVEQIIL